MAMTTERALVPQRALLPSEEAERKAAYDLAARARNGTHAVLAIRLLSVLSSLASITILARLIPPADFGVWAMAGLALGLMTILREMGLMSSIVQARNLTVEQQDTYFWASVAVSLASAVLLALAAPLLARIYDTALLQPVVWVCCISLAVNGLGFVHAALLRRRLLYQKLVVVEGGGMLTGLVVGLTCAYLWRDVWALVAGHVASAIWMSSTALVLCRWIPRWPGRAPARINLSFSLQLTLYNVLTYAGNNVGLAAGYRFGAADLGFFNRGQQLYHLAHFAFLTPITEVGFTLLCRLKSDVLYRNAYIALARRVSVLFIPFAAVLPILAADLILTLLGPVWMPAAPILAWFAPAVFGQAFASLFAQLMTSQGRGDELRSWAVVDLLLRGGGAVVGSQFGLVGLAAGFSLATFFLTVPLMVWIAGRRGPVKLRHQLAAMWPGAILGVAATLGAVAGALGAEALNVDAGLSRLLFVGGSAALAWAALCLLVVPARDALLGKEIRT
jgi:O-antigen/teichoic acid export membrane protein